MGLAARRSRQLTDEVEQIDDPAELAEVRWQARQVQIKAVLVAIPLTLIALALPQRSRSHAAPRDNAL